MTRRETIRKRLDGQYDHWKKWTRLRNYAGTAQSQLQIGRQHKKYLRSAIAYRFWIMRSRRQPFAIIRD